MWTAKVKFKEEGTLIGSKVVKHQINVFGFPLSYFYEKDYVLVHIAGTIWGNKENILNFIKELKKEKRVVNLEIKENFFIGIIKEPKYTTFIYNPKIILLTPALLSNEGYEIVNVGSFEKKDLEKFIEVIEKKLGVNFFL
jgi:hypothetical protein